MNFHSFLQTSRKNHKMVFDICCSKEISKKKEKIQKKFQKVLALNQKICYTICIKAFRSERQIGPY